MAKQPEWTPNEDTELRRLNTAKTSVDDMAAALNRSRAAVYYRLSVIGIARSPNHLSARRTKLVVVETPKPMSKPGERRGPLPAGHPDSWGAISDRPFNE